MTTVVKFAYVKVTTVVNFAYVKVTTLPFSDDSSHVKVTTATHSDDYPCESDYRMEMQRSY